jgi:hypothetical protein
LQNGIWKSVSKLLLRNISDYSVFFRWFYVSVWLSVELNPSQIFYMFFLRLYLWFFFRHLQIIGCHSIWISSSSSYSKITQIKRLLVMYEMRIKNQPYCV